MNAQEALIKSLNDNEHIVQIVETEELIAEWDAVRPKLETAANYTAPTLDAVTAARAIRELGGFSPGKILVRNYSGRQYVIFKGDRRNRKILRGTRYLASNPKVVRMAIGPKGIKRSAQRGFCVTVVLSVGITVFDYFIRDTSTLYELLGTVTGDLIKIGLGALAAAAAGLIAGGAAVLASVPAAPLIAAVAVGIAATMILDKIDERTGATRALIEGYRQIGIDLLEIREEYRRGFREIQRNPNYLRCFFMPCMEPSRF